MKYEEFAVLGVFLAFLFLINNLYTYHAYGEIVVDDIVRYPGVRYFLIRVRRCRIRQLYEPPIQHDRGSPGDLVQDLVDGLSLVAAAPSQTSRQVVSGAQRYHRHGWLALQFHFIWKKKKSDEKYVHIFLLNCFSCFRSCINTLYDVIALSVVFHLSLFFI